MTAVVTLVALSAGPALAEPPGNDAPDTASEALAKYRKLNKRAEMVNEDLLEATDILRKKKKQERKAAADLEKAGKLKASALAEEERFRDEVDDLATASFQGARFNKLSALLTGTSAQDFLDRASALNVLATDSKRVLDRYSAAVADAAEAERKADEARKSATEAKQTQQKMVKRIRAKKKELNREKNEVAEAYHKLSAQERDNLGGGGGGGFTYLPRAGLPNAAVETALAQVGDTYNLGATGPDVFDCSGLMLFAYQRVGVNLPRSSRMQYTHPGVSVSTGQLQPGDLLFYGGSPSSIHHVAMYVGGGQLVHASTYGVGVVTADAPYGGGDDYLGARRIW